MGKLIDVKPLIDRCNRNANWARSNRHMKEAMDWESRIEMLLRAPAVDAVPVVRCKDCRHASEWKDALPDKTAYFCPFRQLDEVEANDFCSYGELKEKTDGKAD